MQFVHAHTPVAGCKAVSLFNMTLFILSFSPIDTLDVLLQDYTCFIQFMSYMKSD